MMSKHLTFEELFMLREGELGQDDKHRVLKHLEECDECRKKLIEMEKLELKLAETSLVEPPRGLKEDILSNAYETVSSKTHGKFGKIFSYLVLTISVVLWYIVFIYTGIVKLFVSDIARRTVKNFVFKLYGTFETAMNFIKFLLNKPEAYFLAHVVGFIIFSIFIFIFKGRKGDEKA